MYERDPKNYGEAMGSAKSKDWQIVMHEELKALEGSDVWRLIKRSVGSNALHTKRVYKTKTNADGDVERLKARIVAGGNEQVFGVDYVLTVMDMSTFNVIMALTATWGGSTQNMVTSPTPTLRPIKWPTSRSTEIAQRDGRKQRYRQ